MAGLEVGFAVADAPRPHRPPSKLWCVPFMGYARLMGYIGAYSGFDRRSAPGNNEVVLARIQAEF